MKEEKDDPVRAYLSEIGSRGGSAKVPKGFAALTSEQRAVNAKKAAKTRWAKKAKKKSGKAK